MTPFSSQNVSRETFSKLENYVALLQKWNQRINLVGKSTEAEIWQRHIDDALQLIPHIPSVKTLADLGSGAGLPGIVIGIARPEIAVTLIEQDQRKAAFLQEVYAKLELPNVTVLNKNIHTVSEKFAFITARALASLSELFTMALPLLEGPNAICLFPKGKNFANELKEVQEDWAFDYHLTNSSTQDEATIISVSKLSNRQHV